MGLGDDVGDAITDIVAEHGTDCVYSRGEESIALRCYISRQLPVVIETEPGEYIEVMGVDIVAPTASLLMGEPLHGDRISHGSDIYEVQPTTNQKTFRVISSEMTRVHTKKVF